ncbi:MAG: hypothetical protein IAE91_02650 [Ignavibacteriaceae bacterium]|nr:hypothetical protein [Ignavibacteriaceae bacterium]
MSKVKNVTTKQKQVKRVSSKRVSPFEIYTDNMNYLLLGGGIFLLILGYFLMSTGTWDSTESLWLSPIVLFIAYIIVFPLAIMFFKKKNNSDPVEDTSETT